MAGGQAGRCLCGRQILALLLCFLWMAAWVAGQQPAPWTMAVQQGAGGPVQVVQCSVVATVP